MRHFLASLFESLCPVLLSSCSRCTKSSERCSKNTIAPSFIYEFMQTSPSCP